MTLVLANYRSTEAADFAHAWVGIEPTFQTEQSVRKWVKMTAHPGGE